MNSTTNIDRLIHLYEKRVLSKNFVLDIGYLSNSGSGQNNSLSQDDVFEFENPADLDEETVKMDISRAGWIYLPRLIDDLFFELDEGYDYIVTGIFYNIVKDPNVHKLLSKISVLWQKYDLRVVRGDLREVLIEAANKSLHNQFGQEEAEKTIQYLKYYLKLSEQCVPQMAKRR